MKIFEWVKEHPYLSGGFVLGIVILIFVHSSSSGNAVSAATTSAGVDGSGLSSGDYASLQAAQLQSGTQLQEATLQANAQTSNINAQVAATQIQANSQVQIAQLQQQADLQSTLTGGQVSLDTNHSTLQAILAQTGAQVSIAGIQTQGTTDVASIQSQTIQDQYDDAVKSQQIISDAQTAQGAQLAAVYESLNGVKTSSDPTTTTTTSGSGSSFTPFSATAPSVATSHLPAGGGFSVPSETAALGVKGTPVTTTRKPVGSKLVSALFGG